MHVMCLVRTKITNKVRWGRIWRPLAICNVSILMNVEAKFLESLLCCQYRSVSINYSPAYPTKFLKTTFGLIEFVDPLVSFPVPTLQTVLKRLEPRVESNDAYDN